MLRIATKLAQDRLTVFIWDGVESMDDESQALVDAVLRGARETRVMAILAYRPGFVHAWGDLRGYYELPLGPLTDDDVARLTGTASAPRRCRRSSCARWR